MTSLLSRPPVRVIEEEQLKELEKESTNANFVLQYEKSSPSLAVDVKNVWIAVEID